MGWDHCKEHAVSLQTVVMARPLCPRTFRPVEPPWKRRKKGQWLRLSDDVSAEECLFILKTAQETGSSPSTLVADLEGVVCIQSKTSQMYLTFQGGRGGEKVHMHMWDNPQEDHSRWIPGA